MSNSEQVVVFAEIKHETDRAFLLTDGIVEAWVPKSKAKQTGDGVWSMPVWLADKKGFSHD